MENGHVKGQPPEPAEGHHSEDTHERREDRACHDQGRDTGLPVRVWDAVLKHQIERTAEGLEAAKALLDDFNEAKRRPGRLQAQRVRFVDVAARYLVAYKVKRDGTPRPWSSLAKERTILNVYLIPTLGNAWVGDLDLPELNDTIKGLIKPGLGDVAILLAFTGLRWEEAVAVPADNVDLDGQCLLIDRTASESGGRRDVREVMKTRAAVRTAMIPDIAMPAARRLVERGAAGRERSGGRLYSRLINGDRGGYLGYATWRKYLALAHGFTAAHKDGPVTYTAHELRHVCASLMIASGASDMQVANQMGHSRVETTKNIYGHLFAQDRAFILDAINQAVSRLYVHEGGEEEAA